MSRSAVSIARSASSTSGCRSSRRSAPANSGPRVATSMSRVSAGSLAATPSMSSRTSAVVLLGSRSDPETPTMRNDSVMIRGYARVSPTAGPPTWGVTCARPGSVHLVGVRADPTAAVARVERIDRTHLRIRQGEVEDVEVLLEALAAHRLGEHDEALLQVPAQHDLGRSLLVGGRRILDRGDAEQVVLALAERP